MAYNLLVERWITVRRRSGAVESITPAQIAERSDPPVRIASPRPDFDGALLEFLVALFQTAAAPTSERAWREALAAPPSVEALARRLASVREAFDLDGNGPRFMQDLTVDRDPKKNREPIGALLIDRIGESGLSQAPSLFAKPGLFERLGYPSAAAALMALQSYAPAGGRGQFTSLRGGGPLTTLLTGDDLWATVWLNVLPRNRFEELVPGDRDLDTPAAIFPWMAKTRGGRTPPQKVHPLQHLWGLPRRIRLEFDQSETGVCSVSGAQGPVVTAYVNRPDGTSYEGDFRHPYTPYSALKPGEPWNAKKGSADGLPYRDWPLLVTGGEKRAPAAVVTHFASARREAAGGVRLLAFGYAMDKMKPLRWCRAETPFVAVPPDLAESFASQVEAFVAASEDVRRTLTFQVKCAWSDRPKDLDAPPHLNAAFWSRTEQTFFDAVHGLATALERGATDERDRLAERWLAQLHTAALELFDVIVSPSPELATADLRRAVQARRSLELETRPSSQKLRKLLGLTVEEAGAGRTPQAKSTHRKKEEES